MYVYVCMSACVYVMYVMYVCDVCMYVCVYVFMHVCNACNALDVCIFACMHAFMYVYGDVKSPELHSSDPSMLEFLLRDAALDARDF